MSAEATLRALRAQMLYELATHMYEGEERKPRLSRLKRLDMADLFAEYRRTLCIFEPTQDDAMAWCLANGVEI